MHLSSKVFLECIRLPWVICASGEGCRRGRDVRFAANTGHSGRLTLIMLSFLDWGA
jgi:hypothetical protein